MKHTIENKSTKRVGMIYNLLESFSSENFIDRLHCCNSVESLKEYLWDNYSHNNWKGQWCVI